MSKPKADLEIRKAKDALELEVSETLHIITSQFHKQYPQWMITDMDIGIIDISTFDEQRRMTASSRVELTSKDLELKICKAGQVKEVR